VAQALEFAAPVVRGAARLHPYLHGLVCGEEAPEAGPGKPVLGVHATRRVRDRDLKHGLCPTATWVVFIGLLLLVAFKGR
jgi:hypothetical protein